tara:strand:- start:15749 stop:17767 length:2019 start_codon:yes stop_codon:yes gene_type:complete
MSLTGKQIANSYKDLLQLQNDNEGVYNASTPITVRDGDGYATPLQLSQNTVNINGNFEYNGVQLTTNVSGLNAAATGSSLVTGIVAEDGSSKYGRTLTASTGVTITNADGASGNPTFALADTSVSAAAYGPMNTITVDAQGRITDVTAATTISANAFIGGKLSGSSLYVENNVSVSGTMAIAGDTNISGAVSIAGNTSIGGNLQVGGSFGIGGATSISGKLAVENIITSVISATFLHGDGSNITGLAGAGTMTQIDANTGIFMTTNGTTTTNITGSGTIGLKTDQSFGVVSATSFVIGGDNVAMSATLAALSATMATSISNSNTNITANTNAITSVNTVIAGVSALTSVNAAAVTSINTVVENLSATMATSIGNRTTAITSINTVVENLSATMATSINNRTTAITSINTVITNLSATLATSIANVDNSTAITSINTVIENLSATLATSIGNSNTNITTNANAITSINTVVENLSATMATSIGNRTSAITSINTVITNLSATMATSIGNQLPLTGGTLTGTLNGTAAAFTGEVSATNLVGSNVSVTGKVVATSVSSGHIFGDIFQGKINFASITDSSKTPPFSTNTNFVYTLKNNVAFNNPSGEPHGASGIFVLIQDGTGNRTVSWGSSYRLPGGTAITLSTDSSAVDIIPYFVQVTGTVLIGNPTLNIKVSA